jgi:ADP-L-glycero-D-manno-heptose 6-epimerase
MERGLGVKYFRIQKRPLFATIKFMIIVTGAAGFIGSNIVAALNVHGSRVVAVDVPGADAKTGNLADLAVHAYVAKDAAVDWLSAHADEVDGVVHMGACSDTTETNRQYMMSTNFDYTCRLWEACTRLRKRFIYASSAATYGDGSLGYNDRDDPARLRPLNLYGESKQRFDLWALEQPAAPPLWAGLKFFNVFGPREQHKARMASVVYHFFHQIQNTGRARLFKSDHPDYPDGGQMRDFIYVKDAVAAVLHFLHAPASGTRGLINVGTGVARSYRDLTLAIFSALNHAPHIDYIPMPEDLKGRYQYFTQADTAKLRASGFAHTFHTLEDGVADYVRKHLMPHPHAAPTRGTSST